MLDFFEREGIMVFCMKYIGLRLFMFVMIFNFIFLILMVNLECFEYLFIVFDWIVYGVLKWNCEFIRGLIVCFNGICIWVSLVLVSVVVFDSCV